MVTYEDMQRERLQNDPEAISIELCKMQCQGKGLTEEFQELEKRLDDLYHA